MAKSISLSFILDQFSKLQTAIREWEADKYPESFTTYGVVSIKIVPKQLRNEIESFLDSTADIGKDVDLEARPIVQAIDTFALAYDDFAREIETSMSPARTDRLWISLNRIAEKANEKYVSRKPRSVALLVKDGVQFQQIASIYGWKLPDGNPDTVKVSEEFENPGTHYIADTWQDPVMKSRFESIEREWSLRANKRSPKFARPEETPNPNWVPPSVALMIQAGAPAEQIATVHKMTVEEAQDRINEAFEARLAEEAESNLASREVAAPVPPASSAESTSTANGQLSGV